MTIPRLDGNDESLDPIALIEPLACKPVSFQVMVFHWLPQKWGLEMECFFQDSAFNLYITTRWFRNVSNIFSKSSPPKKLGKMMLNPCWWYVCLHFFSSPLFFSVEITNVGCLDLDNCVANHQYILPEMDECPHHPKNMRVSFKTKGLSANHGFFAFMSGFCFFGMYTK